MYKQFGGLLSLVAIFIGLLRATMSSNLVKKKVYELFTNKRWVINVIIVGIFCFYIVNETKNNSSEEALNIREALKKATFGFLIAVLSELGLTIAPFWIFFVVGTHFPGWI